MSPSVNSKHRPPLTKNNMTLAEIATALKGTVNGKWVNVRGPGHNSQDRSLGIKFDPNAPGGFIVRSFAGDDQTECRAYVKSLITKLNGGFCATYEPNHVHAEDALARMTRAMVLWQEAKPPKGTIVETYLRRRRCSLEPVLGADAIRFHPCCAFRADRVPVMLALITDAVTGKPIGVHRTAIKDDGSAKRFGKDSKMMVGVARRGAVRLHAASEHLGIAEGVETALSAMQVFKTAVWATLSSGGIARFPILPGIRLLTVFADHDQPGIAAAERCCRRYNAAGIDAEIRHPTQPGTDWNDYLTRETK
jgi:putative DNA primase/helicase